MRRLVLYVSLVVGLASLAWGYFDGGIANLGRWLVLLGLVWIFAQTQNARWFAPLGLVVSVAAAAYGLWMGLSTGWMLAGAVGALFAWDLSEFDRRMHLAAFEDDLPGMERRHLLRLTILAGVGFLLSLIGMLATFKFSFEWAAFLAILAALGVTQLVARMRRGDE